MQQLLCVFGDKFNKSVIITPFCQNRVQLWEGSLTLSCSCHCVCVSQSWPPEMHLNSVPAGWGSDPCLLHTLYFWLSGQRRYQQGKEPVLGVLSKENYSPVLWSWRFWVPIHKPGLQAKTMQDNCPLFRYSNLIFLLLLSEECSSSSLFLVWFLSLILLILNWCNA